MQRYKLLQRPNTTIFLLVLNFFKRGGGVEKKNLLHYKYKRSRLLYIIKSDTAFIKSRTSGNHPHNVSKSPASPRTRDHWSCEDVREIFSVISFINLYWKKISWTNFYFEDTLCKYATWTFKLTYVGKLIIYNTVPSCLCEQLEYISLLQRDHLTWNTSMYTSITL